MQEHLASVGSSTLLVTSGQALMNSMLNAHEQPAVLSAVMKQQMTTRMRQNINDGMDVRELFCFPQSPPPTKKKKTFLFSFVFSFVGLCGFPL